jgi:hypothetical protein
VIKRAGHGTQRADERDARPSKRIVCIAQSRSRSFDGGGRWIGRPERRLANNWR